MSECVTVAGPLVHTALAQVLGIEGPSRRLPGRLTGGLRAGIVRDDWPTLDDVPGQWFVATDTQWTPQLRRYADIMGLQARDIGGVPVLGLASPGTEAGQQHGEWPAALAAEVARDLLAQPAERPAAEIAHRLPRLAAWAASRLRAQAERGAPLPPGPPGADRVRVEARREPYAHYFTVEERRLRHRLHRGGWSDPVERAVFVSGDAVVVLPWDPVRDRVLVVDQFRAGPAVRGDGQPWILEPVAGRIDAGETPESTARREADEEAGLRLDRLFPAPASYPSPGMVAEFMYAFVAIADLPDGVTGVNGLETEHEDIRSHLIARAELTRMALDGRIVSGPLLLLALWLDRQADGLLRATGG